MEKKHYDKKKRISNSDNNFDESILNWMDENLTQLFIVNAGIKNQNEITDIKLKIWDFIAGLKQKLSDKDYRKRNNFRTP